MKLLWKTNPPTNKSETFQLSIENTEILIAIIPGSKTFKEIKPYSEENIKQRVEDWQKSAGFSTPDEFIDLLKTFQSRLK